MHAFAESSLTVAAQAVASPDSGPGLRHWPASLHLQLALEAECTRVVRNRHFGPLRLQRPFYPEPRDCAHLYILHPPGGLVSGDNLHLQIDAGRQTRSLVTTPSAGKVYHAASTGETQRQTAHLKLAEGAQLEWLPQDNIVFNGARGELGLRVDLATGSRFFGWEITCLGRAAGAQPFTHGALVQWLAFYRDGKPWLLERMPLVATGANAATGDLMHSTLMQSPWALAGHTLFATAIATLGHLDPGAQKDTLNLARDCLGNAPAGATRTRDLLIIRLFGNDSETVRNRLIALWSQLRPRILDRPACPPRIWAT